MSQILHVGSRLSPILDICVDLNLFKLFKLVDQTKSPAKQMLWVVFIASLAFIQHCQIASNVLGARSECFFPP